MKKIIVVQDDYEEALIHEKHKTFLYIVSIIILSLLIILIAPKALGNYFKNVPDNSNMIETASIVVNGIYSDINTLIKYISKDSYKECLAREAERDYNLEKIQESEDIYSTVFIKGMIGSVGEVHIENYEHEADKLVDFVQNYLNKEVWKEFVRLGGKVTIVGDNYGENNSNGRLSVAEYQKDITGVSADEALYNNNCTQTQLGITTCVLSKFDEKTYIKSIEVAVRETNNFDTLYHEFGHVADFIHIEETGSRYSNYESFENLFNQYNDLIKSEFGSYAASEVNECFATMYAVYIESQIKNKEPLLLSNITKLMYDYVVTCANE